MKQTSNSIDISTRVSLEILGVLLLLGGVSRRANLIVGASDVKGKSQVPATPSSKQRLNRVPVVRSCPLH